MTAKHLAEVDTARAQELWTAYQGQHDISSHLGQTAGIDPASGQVWFGDSALAVVENMHADGLDAPLYFVRVGFDYYVRKGGHR